MARTFKDLLQNTDELLLTFAVGRFIHPIVIDMFGLAGGYHGFWIDQEHCGVEVTDIITASTAARANGFDCFVRMAPTGYSQVTQNLETGVGGVMAAQIESAAHAEEFVKWCKFAPRGVRGLNTSGFDGKFTHKSAAQMAEEANDENFVVIQIELASAAEEADEIAALDGVDMLFVGPSDLSMSLGVVGQFHHEKLWEAIDKVAAACKKHGKTWSTLPPDTEYAEKAIDRGCRMLTLGNEIVAMRRGIDAIKSTFGGQFGG